MTTEEKWVKEISKWLVGKTIKSVSYLTKNEAEQMYWDSRPIVLEMTDGTLLFPSAEDEGNNGGALFGQTAKGEEITCPVMW